MRRPQTPKKTETIELRLPFETKQAFMARCRDAGVSASAALRGFIDGYVADRPRPRRVATPLRAGLAAGALVAVAALAQPSLARAGVEAAYGRLDADHDGRVTFAEFSRAASPKIDLDLGSGAPVRAGAALPAVLREAILREEFDRIDADHDGEISLAEFRRAGSGAGR